MFVCNKYMAQQMTASIRVNELYEIISIQEIYFFFLLTPIQKVKVQLF